MTDEERLHPTWKSRLIEGGKISGAVASILALAGLVWSVTLGPARDVWASFLAVIESVEEMQQKQVALQSDQQKTLSQLAGVVQQQTNLLMRVEKLEEGRAVDKSPAIRFARQGSSISDGAPGDVVEISWIFYKLRDCGRPIIDLRFRNGGGRVHRFENISVTDAAGRGIAVDPDPTQPQTIKYTGRIPSNDGVEPGFGFGQVSVSYPETCPGVAPVTSPEVHFTILPEVPDTASD